MGLRLCALRRATEHHTQPVNDIQIRSLGYDRRRGRLEIEFTWTDDVRQFYPVAPALYRQLLAAKPMYLFLKRILELRGVRFQYRALAYMEAGRGELISRNGNTFRGSADLATWIAEHLRVESAVLDGEIACVDESGRPVFRDLLFRCRQCVFIAFDLLYLNGKRPADIATHRRWISKESFASARIHRTR
jgi:KTSC domain